MNLHRQCIAVRAGNFAGQDQSAAHQLVATLADVSAELIEQVAAAAAAGYGARSR